MYFIKKAVCPNCQNQIPRFGIKKILFPENAAWFKPKKIIKICPSCNIHLEDKLPNFSWFVFPYIPLSISAKNHSDIYVNYVAFSFLVLALIWVFYGFFSKSPYKLSINKN